MDHPVFALLDDCNATEQHPSSRLYTGLVREHRCTDPRTLNTFWQQVEQDQQMGLHAVLFADYEWGCKLQQAGLRTTDGDAPGALRVLMFRQLQRLSSAEVNHWLAAADGDQPSPAGIRDLKPDTEPARYAQDIAHIRARIAQGETYQVNYTLRMVGAQYGSPMGLYRRLRTMQPAPFAVLARLPVASEQDVAWVLSHSPELFVQHCAGQLSARPMKGTAKRMANVQADQQQIEWLQQDAKNRAENVMIVDLLRNDLGRISKTGSVRVPHLFSVETYATVHQMTSTVESHLRPDVGFPDVLRALFPCGSITGAPKLHTMDLIAGLEAAPRGLYCGAIGWLDAPQSPAKTGDFCLSVAIRTLLLGAERDGQRRASLGVGSGVVMDSNAHDEYAEVQTKARFLTAMDPGFTLFETMRVRGNRIHALTQHLQRLKQSAHSLGFQFDKARIQTALNQQLQLLNPAQTYRLRLDLRHDGGIQLQHAVLQALPDGPARLVLSSSPVRPAEAALLNFKTSLRGDYDTAIQQAMALGAFDAIFVNAAGEVCEGARSNLLVKIQGRWITPPLASGVLPGVMRSRLLKRFAQIEERPLPLAEVMKADALLVCSALRGVQRAKWLRDEAGKVVLL